MARVGDIRLRKHLSSLLIALLIAVSFYVGLEMIAYRSIKEHSARARAVLELSRIRDALRAYQTDYIAFPDESAGLKILFSAPPGSKDWRGPYTAPIGNDPWNHPYIFHPTQNGGYVLISMGPDEKAGTLDDIFPPTSASATSPANSMH